MGDQESGPARLWREARGFHERRKAAATVSAFETIVLVLLAAALLVSFGLFRLDTQRSEWYAWVYLAACLANALFSGIAAARDAQMSGTARAGFAVLLLAIWGVIGSLPHIALVVLAR